MAFELEAVRASLGSQIVTPALLAARLGPVSFQNLRRAYFPRYRPAPEDTPRPLQSFRKVEVSTEFERQVAIAVAPPDVRFSVHVVPEPV